MCNVRFNLPAFLAAAALAVSCSSADKADRQAAQALVAEIDACMQHGRYVEALELMDSVDRAYPRQLQERREVTRLRAKAMTEFSQQQLIATDSLISVLEARLQTLQPAFKHVDGGDLPGYFVRRDADKAAFLASTGIQARVDDDDLSFYIVAINGGRPIGINRFAIEGDGSSVSSSAIPAGNDRVGDIAAGGIDMASFIASEALPVIDWARENASSARRVVLYGTDGASVSARFTPAEAAALVDAWDMADAARRLQLARIQRDKFEQQLIISRDHEVNL